MIADLIYARDYVNQRKLWVVVVVPPECLTEAQTAMAAVANGYPFGGRTVVFPEGGRLSLALASDAVFLPADQSFSAMFLGWGGDKKAATTAKEMTRWRKAASKVLSRAS